ncbi:hypothetical protein FOCC_FOCC014170 [Frankliniella occidentalis]|uniref:Uncharacterized protein LOC113206160 isoform X1 n=1 Tax=Frankliniella occidentalis TaxID=133901 RepID=A0A6J1S9M5_FRAOC|nr:uncharacterized protein LOC113206160 isoform X1 [Frankliniella occidentalis]KAE8740322.1 hypothetical protein FOCC_FOCC014170 [Frankliniella occidentalis]
MKTIMKTALLACLLLAALQFGQASPAPAPAETKPTTSLTAPVRGSCINRMIQKFILEETALLYFCVEISKSYSSLPFFVTFPICAVMSGGQEINRILNDFVHCIAP